MHAVNETVDSVARMDIRLDDLVNIRADLTEYLTFQEPLILNGVKPSINVKQWK